MLTVTPVHVSQCYLAITPSSAAGFPFSACSSAVASCRKPCRSASTCSQQTANPSQPLQGQVMLLLRTH